MRLAGVLIVVAVGLGGMAGCGDDASGPGGAEPGVEASTTLADGAEVVVEPLTAPDLEPPAPGRARVALGGSLDVELDVVRCRLDEGSGSSSTASGANPTVLVDVVAEGATDDGTRVHLELARFVAPGAAVTITDTVTITEGPVGAPDRVHQAQRFEVDGRVTDGRDPGASSPLLVVRGTGVEASGRFAPPGNFVDDGGLVQGAVAVSCPA